MPLGRASRFLKTAHSHPPQECGGSVWWLRVLLHGHAFHEIARLVDLAATDAGDVVGEKLKRNGGRDGLNFAGHLDAIFTRETATATELESHHQ